MLSPHRKVFATAPRESCFAEAPLSQFLTRRHGSRSFMPEFFLALFLMLAVAWVLGEVVHRVGQPALVGQLLGGVLIGPAALNLVQPTAALAVVQNVGLFFIMLITGMVVRPREIMAAGSRAAVVSLFAFALPFAAD
jgi:Kef-type K+ transport system membrane component KefB